MSYCTMLVTCMAVAQRHSLPPARMENPSSMSKNATGAVHPSRTSRLTEFRSADSRVLL